MTSTKDADIRKGACILEYTSRLSCDGVILEDLLLEEGGGLCVQAVYLRVGVSKNLKGILCRSESLTMAFTPLKLRM